ncbi:hypothetical protein Pmani_030631 [Petrolisthes manimaculis]|uniref:Uncharacterized protein n=1 Tax=Petrolisthes manimaculis TaxID=1843537 RepID=A0AAE1NVL3_9EUCA|nr:hypothetical protein Pmani_030631 [Petrolisthes manimaculis]
MNQPVTDTSLTHSALEHRLCEVVFHGLISRFCPEIPNQGREKQESAQSALSNPLTPNFRHAIRAKDICTTYGNLARTRPQNSEEAIRANETRAASGNFACN